jgi:hypothetical protein
MMKPLSSHTVSLLMLQKISGRIVIWGEEDLVVCTKQLLVMDRSAIAAHASQCLIMLQAYKNYYKSWLASPIRARGKSGVGLGPEPLVRRHKSNINYKNYTDYDANLKKLAWQTVNSLFVFSMYV